jgi:hypothetical protein
MDSFSAFFLAAFYNLNKIYLTQKEIDESECQRKIHLKLEKKNQLRKNN